MSFPDQTSSMATPAGDGRLRASFVVACPRSEVRLVRPRATAYRAASGDTCEAGGGWPADVEARGFAHDPQVGPVDGRAALGMNARFPDITSAGPATSARIP